MKTVYCAIVAIDENYAIGKDNLMLTHLPGDLKYFKDITSGHVVVMGYNTYLSLPKGALPNRKNIVITRKKDLVLPNCEICNTITDVIEKTSNQELVFFIGGGQIYHEIIDNVHLSQLFITRIHHKFNDADVFFPPIDDTIWKLRASEDRHKDEKNPYDYTFQQYLKIISS